MAFIVVGTLIDDFLLMLNDDSIWAVFLMKSAFLYVESAFKTEMHCFMGYVHFLPFSTECRERVAFFP